MARKQNTILIHHNDHHIGEKTGKGLALQLKHYWMKFQLSCQVDIVVNLSSCLRKISIANYF
jgi:hypothetical protein